MKAFKIFTNTLIAMMAVFALAACDDGPAENAGEQLDEMTSDAGDAMEDAGDNIEDAANDAGNAIEDACEDVKEGVDAKDRDC